MDELIDRLYRVARSGSLDVGSSERVTMSESAPSAKPANNRVAPPSLAAPLRQPARHHRRRLRHVAGLRRRRAARLHQYRHLQGLRPDHAAIRHHRAGADLRRHHRRDRPFLSLDHGARHGGLLPCHGLCRHALADRRWSPPSRPVPSAAGSTARWSRSSTSPRWSSPSARRFYSAASSWC